MELTEKKEKKSKGSDGVKDTAGEVVVRERELGRFSRKLVYVIGILMAVFHLWVNTVGVMPEFKRNALHFGFVLFLGYLLYPSSKKLSKKLFKLDFILAVLSLVTAGYLILFENALHVRNEVPTLVDLIFAAMVILLLLEMTFRVTGFFIPLLAVLFLGYALFFGQLAGGCGPSGVCR